MDTVTVTASLKIRDGINWMRAAQQKAEAFIVLFPGL